MLLERLGSSLTEIPLAEAVGVLGGLMRRLAVPADPVRCERIFRAFG
ncbi:hypothetical protein [Kribbella deserti]|uniref:Uncharacterized protein n=1 Tax=Kribbella deserti TaxID=1926257 RepID=A0ABV6QHF2_9ACTN